MNMIIPIFNPKIMFVLCNPCLFASRVTSRHHRYATIVVVLVAIKYGLLVLYVIQIVIAVTMVKIELDTTIGQGLF